jgi:hypothetical protein
MEQIATNIPSRRTHKAFWGIGVLLVVVGFLVLTGMIKDKSDSPANYKDVAFSISGKPYTLADTSVKYFGNEVRKDLDGDGEEDVAYLVTHQPGGSGTFYYLVGALKRGKGYVGTQAVLIGDRVAPQSTESGEGRQVIVNYVDRKPTEPMTAQPSVGKSLYLLLDTKTLQFGEVAQNFEGESGSTGNVMNVNARMGQMVSALGIKLTPIEVVQDSRCPKDVQCVWAGTVQIKVSLASGSGTASQTLELGKPFTTEAEEITLTEVEPTRASTDPISAKDYLFHFQIKKRK